MAERVRYYEPARSGRGVFWLFLFLPIVIFVALAGGVAAIQLSRPLPPIEATAAYPETTVIGGPSRAPALPGAGSSIVYVEGVGTIGTAGVVVPKPLASVTKMMTAYVILKSHPLQPGQAGPIVTLTAADGERFIDMIDEDQSALPVEEGETYTQLQLMQGMLIASANNFAEILAAWDAGSVRAFVDKMNAEAQALGMVTTKYGDPSGFSAASVSTPADQLKLAVKLMQDPVFASIVSTEELRLPNIGLIENVNTLLGENGVIGIKTGYTEEAGGNLAFAATHTIEGKPVRIIGMMFGQKDRAAAFSGTRTVLNSIDPYVKTVQVARAGDVVGSVRSAEGKQIDLLLGDDASFLTWPGMTLQATVELDELKAPMAKGAQAGWLTLHLGDNEKRVPIVLAAELPKPGLMWRLQRF